jgi:hypothetical protein
VILGQGSKFHEAAGIHQLLGGSVLWPAGARAQHVPRVGYLSAGTANSDYMRRTLMALEQGLTENGMTRGRDYAGNALRGGDFE